MKTMILTTCPVLRAKEMIVEVLWLTDEVDMTDEVVGKLAELRTLIEAFPLGTPLETLAWLRNWVASSKHLVIDGELSAARYQLIAVRKKLNTLED